MLRFSNQRNGNYDGRTTCVLFFSMIRYVSMAQVICLQSIKFNVDGGSKISVNDHMLLSDYCGSIILRWSLCIESLSELYWTECIVKNESSFVMNGGFKYKWDLKNYNCDLSFFDLITLSLRLKFEYQRNKRKKYTFPFPMYKHVSFYKEFTVDVYLLYIG